MGYTGDGWKFETISHDVQKDSHNCGVFICQFLEALLKGEPLVHMTNVDKYRRVMKHKFRSHSEDISDECLHCEHIGNVPTRKCCVCQRHIDMNCLKQHYPDNVLDENITCYLCLYNS